MSFRLESGMAAALSDASAKSQADGKYTLFFFGTLVHPAILSKIIGNDGSHLSIQPAILPGYVIHHVVNEDYPGLIVKEQSDLLMKRKSIHGEENEKKEEGGRGEGGGGRGRGGRGGRGAIILSTMPSPQAVRGTVVRGLTASDVLKLDIFEGDEYIRIGVKIRPDSTVEALSNEKRPRDESIGKIISTLDEEKITHLIATEPEEAANAYLWRASMEMLEPKIWDFAAFTQSGKDRRWYA